MANLRRAMFGNGISPTEQKQNNLFLGSECAEAECLKPLSTPVVAPPIDTQ
jgi:hypothetical protein